MNASEAKWIQPHEALPHVGQRVWILTEDLKRNRFEARAWLEPNANYTGYIWTTVRGAVENKVLAWWPLPGPLPAPEE